MVRDQLVDLFDGRDIKLKSKPILVSTNWFKPCVFQTDKENQKCAGGAYSKKNSFNCSC